jgi:hypothetical protein
LNRAQHPVVELREKTQFSPSTLSTLELKHITSIHTKKTSCSKAKTTASASTSDSLPGNYSGSVPDDLHEDLNPASPEMATEHTPTEKAFEACRNVRRVATKAFRLPGQHGPYPFIHHRPQGNVDPFCTVFEAHGHTTSANQPTVETEDEQFHKMLSQMERAYVAAALTEAGNAVTKRQEENPSKEAVNKHRIRMRIMYLQTQTRPTSSINWLNGRDVTNTT